MAAFYVWSGAVGTGTGASWVNAKTTLQAAITAGAAGDTYYVAQDHAETAAAATTITFKGTSAAPDIILCVDRAGSVPPVSADLRTTGSITTTGANSLSIGATASATVVYIDGLIFSSGSGATTAALIFNLGWQYFKNCTFVKAGTSAQSAAFSLNGSNTVNSPQTIIWDGCTVQFGNTGDSIRTGQCTFIWKNTASAIAGATLPTTLFAQSSATYTTTNILDGVDLSTLGSGKTLVGAAASGNKFALINCKLGASVTISATPTTPGGTSTDVQISDSSTNQARQERYLYQGTLTTETTIVPTSNPASDGVTPYTWKVATTANTKWQSPFETFVYAEWNGVVDGSTLTRTFEIVNDGTTLTNAEVWAEVEYLGSAATPQASRATSGTADILAAGTNLTTSTATWTTTGLASPVKQVVAVSFVPLMKGFFRITFKFARASKTVYLSPRANES